MKQEPPQTPDITIPSEALSAPIDINELMDVFGVDPDVTTTIETNIQDVTHIIDQKLLVQAKAEREKYQWYNARYTLNTIKDQHNQEIRQLREETYNEIKNAQKMMDSEFFSSPLIKKATIQQVYPDSNIGIGLTKKDIDTWMGMEYGHYVVVWHNGIIHKRHFAYRDGFDAKKDHWGYNFNDIKHVDIEKNDGSFTVTIVLKSNTQEHTTTFTFPDDEEKNTRILSYQEQVEFTSSFEEKKQQLLQKHFKSDARMPMIPPRWMKVWLHLWWSINDNDVPYRTPEIHDEYIDPDNGMGIFIIKSQIDYDHVDGMQFERAAYRIDSNGVSNQLTRELRYEAQLKEGNIVTMKAEDFL